MKLTVKVKDENPFGKTIGRWQKMRDRYNISGKITKKETYGRKIFDTYR